MRAAVMRGTELVVDDIADPRPGAGQVLVRTLACGICGSDLHAPAPRRPDGRDVERGRRLRRRRAAAHGDHGPGRDVVMGHEFCGEVVELGDNTGNCRVGDIVVSVPMTFDLAGLHPSATRTSIPGGYGELMVLTDLVALKVPNGLGPAPRGADRADGRRSARRQPLLGRAPARPPSCSAAGPSAWP